MAWYSAGTVTVTNGSTVVTGAGTDFVSNVTARDGLMVAGGVPLEIASIQSATSLTLASPWLGATGGGQAYKVLPTVGIYVDLALRALNMLTPFQAVIDGIGQGLVPSGSLNAPGLRFTADQDTGVARIAENQIALVAGGASKLTATASYLISQAPFLPPASGNPAVAAFRNDAATSNLRLYTSFPSGTQVDLNSGMNGVSNSGFDIRLNDVSRLAIDPAGNVLIGTSTGSSHAITKAGLSEGGVIAQVDGGAGSGISGQFRRVNANSYNGGAPAALMLGNNTANGRSATVGGTINASGADYAEYMTKAAGSGAIAKGDVCGVNRDGKLVRTWGDAIRFVVKSTDPNLVGGDTWATHLPSRPDAPGEAPIEPVAPAPIAPASLPAEPIREEGEEDVDFIRRMAAYLVEASAAVTAVTADQDALAAYQSAVAAYPAVKAKHDADAASYAQDLVEWEKELEVARRTVDRIAFSGQVPVNVDDVTLAACEAALADGVAVYLVAVARGAGIGVSAVREADMTLPLYMRRVGAVWAIRDGRPWVDVQHG